MNGETGGKAGHPTETQCAWGSRGGRGSAMMGIQFGTKPAYAALGTVLPCGLVLVGMELHAARAQDLVQGVRVVAGRGERAFRLNDRIPGKELRKPYFQYVRPL